MADKCRREFEEWLAQLEAVNYELGWLDCSSLNAQVFNPNKLRDDREAARNYIKAAYDKRTKDAEELVEFIREVANMHDTGLSDYECMPMRAKQALTKWEGHDTN